MRKLSAIRQTVRQFLSDEFVSGSEQDFKDDELDVHIGHCLEEISDYRPYEVKVTADDDDDDLVTTAGSKELDISKISDLIKVEKAEYPVDGEPPCYRNVSVFGNTLRLVIDGSPGDDEAVYLYCWKLHQLTEETSTLSPLLEHVLIDGSVAYTALAWINNVRAQVKEAIAIVADIHTAVGKMEGAEGEGGIAQAIEDLKDGRTLGFNKIYVGGRPLDDYANYARGEQGIANAYRSQVDGYIRELNTRLGISNLISNYQVWANNKLAQYRVDLKGITKQRVSQLYSTS